MSFFKKHVDRRIKEQETIQKIVGNSDAFMLMLHMRNDNKALFIAGRRVL